jgi:cysteine desulfurase family protein (TIGR01976 family)
LHISRSIAKLFNPGDRLVVTRLDHDANITPWTLIAQDNGFEVDWVDFDLEDGTLDKDSLAAALDKKPKLVAVGYASNALGTINPVKQITKMAHDVGALVYVDAVQYAPHGPIDLQDLDVDFLACSAYKFFGPHIGILYGKYDLLEEMKAYKVRPAPPDPPGKFETGTQSFEGIAGVLGALEHLEWIGAEYGKQYQKGSQEKYSGRALQIKLGMEAIRDYEFELSRNLIQTFQKVPGLRLYGLDDPQRVDQRVPTFAINLKEIHPRRVAILLAKQDIFVWDGNYYALAVTERLGVEETGGMVRIGAAHYNTTDEITKLGEALQEISKSD